VVAIALGFLAVAVWLLYFPLQEGRSGKTIGKRLAGIHVLKEDGMPVGYKEATIRRISYYLGGAVFMIDALFIPFTDLHQRGFDIIAKTIVVQDKA
jgi:uncharacterized RDD family membrane protein YckC